MSRSTRGNQSRDQPSRSTRREGNGNSRNGRDESTNGNEAQPALSLGSRIFVKSGKYNGMYGTIVKLTGKKAYLDLDGMKKIVLLYQHQLIPVQSSDPTARGNDDSTSRREPERPSSAVRQGQEPTHANEAQPALSLGSRIFVMGGKYMRMYGTILKLADKKACVDLDGMKKMVILHEHQFILVQSSGSSDGDKPPQKTSKSTNKDDSAKFLDSNSPTSTPDEGSSNSNEPLTAESQPEKDEFPPKTSFKAGTYAWIYKGKYMNHVGEITVECPKTVKIRLANASPPQEPIIRFQAMIPIENSMVNRFGPSSSITTLRMNESNANEENACPLRDETDNIDLYTGTPLQQTGKKNTFESDHIIEVQILDLAWALAIAPYIGDADFENVFSLIQEVVNCRCANMNTTSRLINQKKKGPITAWLGYYQLARCSRDAMVPSLNSIIGKKSKYSPLITDGTFGRILNAMKNAFIKIKERLEICSQGMSPLEIDIIRRFLAELRDMIEKMQIHEAPPHDTD